MSDSLETTTAKAGQPRTCVKMLAKIGHVVLEICSRTDTHGRHNRQNEVMEFEHYKAYAMCIHPRRVDRRKCGQQARQCRCFLTIRSTCRGEICESRVWDKFPDLSTVILEYSNFLISKVYILCIRLLFLYTPGGKGPRG